MLIAYLLYSTLSGLTAIPCCRKGSHGCVSLTYKTGPKMTHPQTQVFWLRTQAVFNFTSKYKHRTFQSFLFRKSKAFVNMIDYQWWNWRLRWDHLSVTFISQRNEFRYKDMKRLACIQPMIKCKAQVYYISFIHLIIHLFNICSWPAMRQVFGRHWEFSNEQNRWKSCPYGTQIPEGKIRQECREGVRMGCLCAMKISLESQKMAP